MAGALAVLGQALQSLINESNILLVDVEPQQTEAAGGAATDTVKELKGLTHKVVVVLFILTT